MATKKEKVRTEGSIDLKGVPIEWRMTEGALTPFASNMVVQALEGVFKVSFFEVKPPIILDESAPRPDKIRADCVASVFIAPDKLLKFIEALQKNYDKYMAREKSK